MASVDDIIRGSFESLGMPAMTPAEQLRWNAAYGKPIEVPPPSAPYVPTALAYKPAPKSNSAVSAATSLGSRSVPLPQRRPASAPTRMDMAAINAAGRPVTKVSAPMSTAGKPGWQFGDGLLSLLTGESKNGMGGLLGLLGGPQQGGLIQMLMGGQKAAPTARASAPRAAGTPIPVLPGDSPAAAAAKAAGSRTYSASPGNIMPTTSISGKSRRTYGDSPSSDNGGNPSWW